MSKEACGRPSDRVFCAYTRANPTRPRARRGRTIRGRSGNLAEDDCRDRAKSGRTNDRNGRESKWMNKRSAGWTTRDLSLIVTVNLTCNKRQTHVSRSTYGATSKNFFTGQSSCFFSIRCDYNASSSDEQHLKIACRKIRTCFFIISLSGYVRTNACRIFLLEINATVYERIIIHCI